MIQDLNKMSFEKYSKFRSQSEIKKFDLAVKNRIIKGIGKKARSRRLTDILIKEGGLDV